ncbi:aldehyde dehydrogenase family protein, partial [Klebsiella pneumoniae]|nr:aldehyde dehydrogenase family protein [Klebsiella pneumoniae]
GGGSTPADVPDGVFNRVPSGGAGGGAAMTAHPQVVKVSFTGSTATGKQIARAACDPLPRVALGPGGQDPGVWVNRRHPPGVIGGGGT